MDTRYLPNGKRILTSIAKAVWIMVVIAATAGFPIKPNHAIAQADSPYWRDEFDAETLDLAWYWVNENPSMWSLTERPGFLRIYTSPYATGGENLLLRPVGQDDFVIQTHLFFGPNTNFQFAGLVVYQDQDNYLQFGRAFCDVPDVCVGNGIYFDELENGGFSGSNYATSTASQNQAFLRLVRQGGMVTALYSEGGIAWQLIGAHEVSEGFVVNAVGLTASQDNENIVIAADFDYFSLTTYSKLPSPFIGNWQAIDVDGSELRMAIAGPPHGPFQITLTDKYISFCGGEAGIVRGTGWLDDSDLTVLDADLHLSCFTTGATLDYHLVWRYHPSTNTLSSRDGSGLVIIWHRPGRPQPSPPRLDLRVNYGHDWVESFYAAGHMVWLTVTESDGVTVKATAEVVTEPKDFWGGETGFQTRPEDWVPGPPDIQPYDWVYGWVDNGASAQVQIGDISGMIDLAADFVEGTIYAPWFSSDVSVECFPWGAPYPTEMKFDTILPDGNDTYSCSWSGEWDIQPGQDVGVGYLDPDGHWVANAFFIPYHDPRIIASAAGDWFWTADFMPNAALTLSIYASQDSATALWTGSRDADEWGFVLVGYPDHKIDLAPGNYLTVSDGIFEKGLVLETITIDRLDSANEIMAGTAPAGRAVRVVAGLQEAETQAVIDVVADPGSGAWMADFRTNPFNITEEMRTWSFAQIFDGDGDANEASPPPLPEAIQWLAAYSYDPPDGTFVNGVHPYHFEFEWTIPETGALSGQEGELLVSSEASIYDGYVLLRGPAELHGIDTPDGLACEDVDAIRPEQPTRFLIGWVTDSPKTYEEAIAHFESITARVVWDGGMSAELARHEIFPYSSQLDWVQYACTFTR